MNSSFPRLSLVIPCYNEERTLRDCVTRCLALRERNIDLELVIVDEMGRQFRTPCYAAI